MSVSAESDPHGTARFEHEYRFQRAARAQRQALSERHRASKCYSQSIVIIVVVIVIIVRIITKNVPSEVALSWRRCPVWGRGTPLPPCPLVHLLHLFPFYFSLSFIGFTYFLLLSIPSLSTRIVPLRFQAGGRGRRPNLDLVFLFYLCYLYSLVKMHCDVLLI